MKKSLSKGLTGIASEYYAAAELSVQGYMAAVTLRNNESIDILAFRQADSKQFAIQIRYSGSKEASDSGSKEASDSGSKEATLECFLEMIWNYLVLKKQDGKPNFIYEQTTFNFKITFRW